MSGIGILGMVLRIRQNPETPRRMHRLRQGRERQGHRGPLQLLCRQQERHRGIGQLQGQGQHPLGQRVHALEAEVRLYDRLSSDPQPDAGGKDFKLALNPKAKEVVTAYLEPGMQHAHPGHHYQFERHGYFVADREDSVLGKPVFNRIVTLKDSWAKISARRRETQAVSARPWRRDPGAMHARHRSSQRPAATAVRGRRPEHLCLPYPAIQRAGCRARRSMRFSPWSGAAAFQLPCPAKSVPCPALGSTLWQYDARRLTASLISGVRTAFN